MERTIPPPHSSPHPPTRFAPPPGACDAHCHVFGPASKFPFAQGRTYTPPDAGIEDLQVLQKRLGLSRAVLVQASCHGTDNRAMIDALRRGEGRYAGVAMIDGSHTRKDLEEMHEAGVRGIRFNFVKHLGGGPDLELMRALVDKVASLNWHLDLHFDAADLPEHSDLLADLPVPFIIDHMARIRVGSGPDQTAFVSLLGLLRSNANAWVKVSGAERISADGSAPFDDVTPFARQLIEVAPERVLWGTDWPHPNVRTVPDDGDLVDLLADFAPDEETRHHILVDNPTRLYDFSV